MKASDCDIITLIPQRPPMVMIDKLTGVTAKSARGKLLIEEKNLFCHNGFFHEAGLMEFIAQTAAAYTGFQRLIAHKEVSEGYIGAIKNLIIKLLPPAGREIQSEIVVENELLGYTIVTGKIYFENEVIAECEMRILLKTE